MEKRKLKLSDNASHQHLQAVFRDDGKKIIVNQVALRKLIEELGFGICRDNQSPYNNKLIFKKDNIIEVYNEKNLAYDLIELMEGSEIDENSIETLVRGSASYFATNKIQLLKTIELDLLEDTRKETFIPFANVVVKITANGYEILEYKNLKKSVLSDARVKHDFAEVETSDGCNFKEFCKLITGKNPERFNNLKAILGYLLHTDKSKQDNKAIIIYDTDIHNQETANGGNGKSLLITGAIRQLRNVVKFDGKSYDPRPNRFMFQRVSPSTNVILFDDVNKNFCFERLYTLLTSEIEVEQKNRQSFVLDYQHAPKFVITSNHIVEMEPGSSSERRKIELVLDHFFSNKLSPIDYFNEIFFSEDWNSERFNKFFKFMLECILFFHNEGVYQYEAPELQKFKTEDIFGKELLGFVETKLTNSIDEWVDQRQFLSELHLETESDISSNMFTRSIKEYCLVKGMIFQQKNSGGILKFMVSLPKATTEDEDIIDYIDTVDENTGEVTTIEVRRKPSDNVVNNQTSNE